MKRLDGEFLSRGIMRTCHKRLWISNDCFAMSLEIEPFRWAWATAPCLVNSLPPTNSSKMFSEHSGRDKNGSAYWFIAAFIHSGKKNIYNVTPQWSCTVVIQCKEGVCGLSCPHHLGNLDSLACQWWKNMLKYEYCCTHLKIIVLS